MRNAIILFVALLCQTGHSQTCDLTLTILNLNSHNGELQIGIYNTKESFPHVDEQYRVLYIDVEGFSGSYTIKNLPAGDYAVALFHDENADKICNTNLLGIPKEGYGFSNNIRPVFSAPSFHDCKIHLDKDMHINIKLIY